jgi:hypothetical protein
MKSLVVLRAIQSCPELYISNQRVVVLVAAVGTIMISESLKSLTSPFTTFAI